jgi:hypothetical protein
MGRLGILKPGIKLPNGLSSGEEDVRMTFVDEMFTTAGKTAFTTGANVVGIDTVSRTGGAAAAAAAAGAWPAWMTEAPTKAPPATDPMHNMSAAMIQTGYLFIRFMVISVLLGLLFEATEK